MFPEQLLPKHFEENQVNVSLYVCREDAYVWSKGQKKKKSQTFLQEMNRNHLCTEDWDTYRHKSTNMCVFKSPRQKIASKKLRVKTIKNAPTNLFYLYNHFRYIWNSFHKIFNASFIDVLMGFNILKHKNKQLFCLSYS